EIEVVVLAARRRRALRAAQPGREHNTAHARHLQKCSSIELSHRLLLYKYGNAYAMQYRWIAIDIPAGKDFVGPRNNAAARTVGRSASRSVSQRCARSADRR